MGQAHITQVYLIGPMKNRSPDFSVGAAGSLCKVSQIFFHILILNAIYHLAFSTVENESKAPCRMQYSLFVSPLALHS